MNGEVESQWLRGQLPSACTAISLSIACWDVATSAQGMGPLERGQCENTAAERALWTRLAR